MTQDLNSWEGDAGWPILGRMTIFFFSGEGGHFVSSTKIKQNEEWVSL